MISSGRLESYSGEGAETPSQRVPETGRVEVTWSAAGDDGGRQDLTAGDDGEGMDKGGKGSWQRG
jgi:hypothetical protein